MVRVIEHSADLGLELSAPTAEGVLSEALAGIREVMFTNPPLAGDIKQQFRLEASDLGLLLVRFLNEMIYWVQNQGFVPTRLEAELSQNQAWVWQGRAWGSDLEASSQGFKGEVKSATLYRLTFAPCPEGWCARVYLDL